MTGLFGGILGTPESRNEQVLRADLELRRKAWLSPGPGYIYRGAGDYLLQHGKFYAGRQIPDRYAQLVGEESMCFNNALQACKADSSLRYCEGCYQTGHGYAMSHAWCVDPDGGLVEVTLPTDPASIAIMRTHDEKIPFLKPEHWGYWGVIFDWRLIEHEFERFNAFAPLFDRSPGELSRGTLKGIDVTSPHDFPILKTLYDPNRRALP